MIAATTEAEATPRMTAGPGAVRAVLRRAQLGDRPLLVHDPAVALPLDELPRGATVHRLDLSVEEGPVDGILARADHPTSIVAIGGGTTVDAAKLARAFLAAPATAEPLRTHAARSGFVRLPASRNPLTPPLIAVPTTLGTGTEVSAVACLDTPWGHRLVSGAALRPEWAVLDPDLTATLPRRLQLEGLFEIILRTLGPAIGSPPASAADHAARAIVHGTVLLAEHVASGDLTSAQRQFAAQLGAATHTGWALVGRSAYGARHWYLANELASAAAARKIPATVAILPTFWSRIADGDARWGSAERLDTAWSWVRAALPVLPSDPVAGLRALLARWDLRGIGPRPDAVIREAAARARSSWGSPLPALARIDEESILQIFVEALAGSTTDETEEGGEKR